MQANLDLMSSYNAVTVVAFISQILSGAVVTEHGFRKIPYLQVYNTIQIYDMPRSEAIYYSDIIFSILNDIITKKNDEFIRKMENKNRAVSNKARNQKRPK